MRPVPWWALLSAGCAPLVLIAGWAVAGLLSGPDYDPGRETISSLEAQGAPGRWLMVGALAALGACHLVTALGLRPARSVGRIALAGGGVVSIMVALFPLPPSGGSLRHGALAAAGFTLLSVWPFLAADPAGSAAAGGGAGGGPAAPWALRRGPAFLVTALMLVGAVWFMAALNHHGAAGTAERLVTALQSCWPLVVALSCARRPAVG